MPGRRLGRALPVILAVGALALLAACGGTMQGVVRGEGSRVTFKYEQGFDRDFYEATIDGEHFKGQAVHADARTGVGVGFAAGTTVPVVTSSTSGNIVAVMFGDRGVHHALQHELRGQFRLHHDGRGRLLPAQRRPRIIDIMW